MSLTPQIASIQAAGVYQFEFDRSQIVNIPAERLRLVVGFSRQGPFNTPVFCPDTAFFTQIFGGINRADERKGSFFHRSALAALQGGPILALNLRRLNDSTDGGDFNESFQFSLSATESNEGYSSDTLYSGYFNKDKFWFPETNAFLNNIGATENQPFNKLFNLVNLGQSPITVLVRKAYQSETLGFDMTVRDWYGQAEIPSYLNPESLISDFMLTVQVFKGNWGADANASFPYERFASDPQFARYFSKQKGLKRKIVSSDISDTSIEEFTQLSQVQLIAQYTGSIIPGFVDLNKNNLFIEDLINTDSFTTGLFASVNKAMFDLGLVLDGVDKGIDMIGHELEKYQPRSIDFMSYKDVIASDLSYAEARSTVTGRASTDITITQGTGDDFIEMVIPSTAGATFTTARSAVAHDLEAGVLGSFILTSDNSKAVPVIAKTETSTQVVLTVSAVGGIDLTDFDYPSSQFKLVNPDMLGFLIQKPLDQGKFIAGPNSTLYDDVEDGILTDGDKAQFGTSFGAAATLYLDFNKVDYDTVHLSGAINAEISDADYNISIIEVSAFANADFTDEITQDSDFGFSIAGKFFYATDESAYVATTLGIQSYKGALNQVIPVLEYSGASGSTLEENEVIVDASYSSAVQAGNLLVQTVGSNSTSSRLVRIKETIGISNYQPDVNAVKVICYGPIGTQNVNSVISVEAYQTIENWVDFYNLITLDGFALTSYQLPDGTNEQQNNILNDTLSGTKLASALTDVENIQFRYIVDTFANGIESGSKSIFFRLAKDRGNCFAIVNPPSVENFKKSTNPSFVNLNGAFDTRLVSTGGDLSKNPTVRYSLPSIVQGSSYGAFYFPYLLVRENGSNIVVPPAAYISNNYISKYTNALPWSSVAGTKRGVISGPGVIGIEYNLSTDDRKWLEPFGLNPVIFDTQSGLTIYANRTAQQNVQSALSSINVREVLIYMADGVRSILKNYVFEDNTPQTRLEIKTIVDNFLTQVQSDGGIFDFRTVMDSSNNGADVIDARKGIIDIYVEPVRNLEVVVSRTTILRTGQISTGQFR